MASIEKRGKRSWRITVWYAHDRKATKTIQPPPGLAGARLRAWLYEQAASFEEEVKRTKGIESFSLTTFYEEWKQYYGKKELAPTTLEAYERYTKLYIIPRLGNKKITELAPRDLITFQRWLDDHDTISHNTKAYIWRVLKNILKRAYEWRYIGRDITEEVRGINYSKRKEKRIPRVWDIEEIKQFLSALQSEPMMWRAFAMLALFGGLRRGEVLGLEWRHVNFERGTVTVEQAVTRGAGGVEIGPPKTETSVRTIALPVFVLGTLRQYREEWQHQREQARDAGLWVTKKEYLFHQGNGAVMYPTTPTAWLRKMIKKAGLPPARVHDLRHMSATLLITAGVPVRVVSDRLGHARTSITQDVYAHVLRRSDAEAAEIFDRLLRTDASPTRHPSTEKKENGAG